MDIAKYFINDEPVNTGFRIGFIAILLISITFIFPTFIGIGYDSPMISNFVDMAIIGLLMTIVFSWALHNKSKKSTTDRWTPIEIGLKNLGKQGTVLMLGIAAGIVLVFVNYIAFAGSNLFLDIQAGTVDMEALYLGLLAGVAEELFFRGFIQTMIRIYAPGMIFAVVPAALIFTFYHYYRYQQPAVLFVVFVLGLFLGFLHEHSNDIGVPMLAHVVNNTYAMLPMVVALLFANSVYLLVLAAIAISVYYFAMNKHLLSGGSKSAGRSKFDQSARLKKFTGRSDYRRDRR